MISVVNSSLYEAWMENEHATLFNLWSRFSTGKLIRLLDEFNEFKLCCRPIAGTPGQCVEQLSRYVNSGIRYFF